MQVENSFADCMAYELSVQACSTLWDRHMERRELEAKERGKGLWHGQLDPSMHVVEMALATFSSCLKEVNHIFIGWVTL